jgi:hypothetical protein
VDQLIEIAQLGNPSLVPSWNIFRSTSFAICAVGCFWSGVADEGIFFASICPIFTATFRSDIAWDKDLRALRTTNPNAFRDLGPAVDASRLKGSFKSAQGSAETWLYRVFADLGLYAKYALDGIVQSVRTSPDPHVLEPITTIKLQFDESLPDELVVKITDAIRLKIQDIAGEMPKVQRS